MNKTRLFCGAAGLLAILAASCSGNDDPVGNGVADKAQYRYMKVNIVNPSAASRTADTDFEDGTKDENKVNSVYMQFYDAAGNYITYAAPSDITWDPTDDSETPSLSGNVGRIGTALVKVGLEQNQNLPAYVVCYINPARFESLTGNMSTLNTVKRYKFRDDNDNFCMSNSCYYGLDNLTNQDNVKISGTPIKAAQLYTSEADAKAAEADKALDIYVERYAAKVKFKLETGAQTGEYETGGKGIYDYTGTTPVPGETETENVAYSLKFIPKAWTVNADESSTFVIKNFTTTEGQAFATYEEVNTFLSGWTTWNEKTKFRSYWASSPAFFATDFPQVSDQLIDNANDGNGAGALVGDFRLKYYSYNQITDPNTTSTADGQTDFSGKGVRYAFENTMHSPAFTSLNPRAAVPSVILVGKYQVTYNGTALDQDGNSTFYLLDKNLYFPHDKADAAAKKLSLLDKFLDEQLILYKKTGTAPNEKYELVKSDYANASDYFTIEHPAKAVRGENLVPHRYVTLQLKAPLSQANKLYYQPTGSTVFTEVTAANQDMVNTLLWQQSGVAEAYTNGCCYFSIPIHHLRWTEDKPEGTDNQLETADGSIIWDNLRPGDLGLVRNHVYSIEVDAIKGLATGIESPDAPLVPPMSVNTYWIRYRINILNWRIVPAQGGIVL